MECKPPSKILQLIQYVSRYPFVLKYRDFEPPETSSGTAPFDYLYDKNYAFEYATPCYAAWRQGSASRPGDLPSYAMFML